jgi:RNA polymerase sigma-70 factor (ECF subfamily)
MKEYKKTNDKLFVGELYKRYSHLVLGMCINYFKDKDEAKDAVVAIFEKLFVELQKHEVNCFKAWLIFMVRNYCLNVLKKRSTQLNRDLEYHYAVNIPLVQSEKEELEEEDVQLKKLEKALLELNAFQKECIEMYYYNKMSYSQIVETTGYSMKEVKSYLQNGKRNLKLLILNSK